MTGHCARLGWNSLLQAHKTENAVSKYNRPTSTGSLIIKYEFVLCGLVIKTLLKSLRSNTKYFFSSSDLLY